MQIHWSGRCAGRKAVRVREEETGRKAPSVLWKAFDVLGAFSHRRRVLTLAEISRSPALRRAFAL
jgi:hypothetical protein